MPTPTFTTRLALTKPDGDPTTGDFVNVATLNANYDKVDAAVGAVACTSGARPAAPFNGQFARETDTKSLIMWTGAAWVYVPTSDGPALAQAFICTSVTRPASPAAGLIIFETDTGRMAVRSGAFWVYPDGTHRQRQTLAATAPSVTFTIPSALRSLQLKWTVRSTHVATAVVLSLRINGNSSTVYAYETMGGTAASASASAASAQTSGRLGSIPAGGATAGVFGSGVVDFVGWDSPHGLHLGYTATSQAMAAGQIAELDGGTYATGGPYTSLTVLPLGGDFAIGSDFQIFGEVS